MVKSNNWNNLEAVFSKRRDSILRDSTDSRTQQLPLQQPHDFTTSQYHDDLSAQQHEDATASTTQYHNSTQISRPLSIPFDTIWTSTGVKARPAVDKDSIPAENTKGLCGARCWVSARIRYVRSRQRNPMTTESLSYSCAENHYQAHFGISRTGQKGLEAALVLEWQIVLAFGLPGKVHSGLLKA